MPSGIHENKICIKCRKPLDREGKLCKLCSFKSIIRTRERAKRVQAEFKELKPKIYAELVKKIQKELDEEEKMRGET